MVHDPYSVNARKPLTAKQRLEMFLRHDGVCCICGTKINGVREAWDEHINPLWLAGDNSAENRAPAHERCARKKTAKEATERAKSRRIAERHFGARKPKNPTEYTRLKHRFKRTVDGRVVPR